MIIEKRQLKTLIACGGEAEIYEGDTSDTVFKIFQKHINFAVKEQKVKALLQSGRFASPASRVVAPLDILTDKKGAFVGYKMTKITDAEALHQFTKTKFCNLRKITNLDIFKILCAVGEALQTIIHNGAAAVIGDLNDHNVVVKTSEKDFGKAAFFIDTDSWGIGNLPPDAYTDGFVPSEAYGKKMSLTPLTDNFSYNVIAWNLLTKIHPFGGVYNGHDNMSVVDRIHKGASVLGKHKKEITIPKIIQSWTWMSPELQDSFKKSFEDGQRDTVYEIIRDQLQNYRYCNAHNTYFYDKYGTCPLCSGKAKIAVAVKKISTGQFVVTEIFSAPNIDFFLDFDKYVIKGVDPSAFIRHVPSGRTIPRGDYTQVEIIDDGNVRNDCFFYADKIIISGDNLAEIPRQHRSPYQVGKNTIWYISPDGQLTSLKLTKAGNVQTVIVPTHNSLFCANDSTGEVFVLQRYHHMSMITRVYNTSNGHQTSLTNELPPIGRIDEYFIQMDAIGRTWVFIYKMPNGLFRTLLFDAPGVKVDRTDIRYTADSLNNMFYVNNTVYDAGDGKITATNLIKNAVKEFPCAEITESSRLRFVDGHFEFISGNKIYKMEVV